MLTTMPRGGGETFTFTEMNSGGVEQLEVFELKYVILRRTKEDQKKSAQ